MKNVRAVGVAMLVASGLLLAAAGTASAEPAAAEPVASTGSAGALGGLIDSLTAGSSDSGSSVSGGIKVGNGNTAVCANGCSK
ncbi:hypothetical protein ACQPW1_19210 [Nocardia sp. CA-128927]|uniref:hypothetical protein n=1 Tax=Nocardia sp. CA-128927 TaxID=3239975 RepID=UPI003D99BEBF